MNLNSLNALNEFWGIVREINLENIEREAGQPFKIIVVGPDQAADDELAHALNGGYTFPGSAVQALNTSANDKVRDLPKADLVIYALPGRQATDYEAARKISEMETQGKPVVLAVCTEDRDQRMELANAISYVFSTLPPHRVVVLNPSDRDEAVARLFPAVTASLPNLDLSLGRALPPFRERVAANLILETSRVNAEFAVFASVPGSIPLVGGIFQTSADLLVLTKNQVMLVLKLAMLYGRRQNKMRTIAEIAPVVGGALFWRTMARTLVDLLPGFIAAMPKALIAFAGTFVVGNMARYYYGVGQKPAGQVLEKIYDDALVEAKTFLKLGR